MGKKSVKISKAMIEIIATGIANGKTLSASAEAAGLTRTTALNWRDRGRESESGLYREFYLEIAAARKRYEQGLLDKMKSFAEEGERLTKVKRTTAPDGSVTVSEEISEGQKYNATRWLLERRVGYDFTSDRASEKVLNRLVKIAEKTLTSEALSDFLDAIMEDSFLSNIEIEDIDGIFDNE